MKNVIIYTDGACSYNPGPGGWAAVLIYKGVEKEISGYNPNTTNNRMELQAVISALELIKEKCIIDIYTDSAYIYNAFVENWISSWLKNEWKTSSKKPVLNIDLWEKLINYNNYHHITWHKVKGHSTDKYNNRCDELARSEIVKNATKIS